MLTSKKKQKELYECIHENIFQLRLKLTKPPFNASSSIDVELAQLENPIWRDIKEILGI